MKILDLNATDLLPNYLENQYHLRPADLKIWMFKPKVQEKIKKYGWANFKHEGSFKIIQSQN